MKEFRNQYSEPLGDHEVISDVIIVVTGQALSGAELFSRMQRGLPVGCAMHNFDQVNPYLEKFSIYDAIGQFRLRHGMVDKSELDDNASNEPSLGEPNPALNGDGAGEGNGQ